MLKSRKTRSLKDHLLDRHFDVNLYKNIIVDEDSQLLTVYLNNLSGQFVGYQQYNHNQSNKDMNCPKESRYYTYSPKGSISVWGLETLNPLDRRIFLVEGIFKASSLHILGYNAVAGLTSHPKHVKSWIHSLGYDIYGIGDADKAGKGVIGVAGKGIQFEKDIDEYPLDELKLLMEDL